MDPKCAIITGGGGELGKVVSAHFLDMGYSIAIPRYPVGHEEGLAPSRPVVRVLERDADLTREEDVKEFVQAAGEAFGEITCLINLAGAYAGGNRVEETSFEEWERMISLNTTTAFLMSRACIPGMRAKGYGRIINIAALPAVRPTAERAAYAVAKRGVVTLTEVLHQELKGSGITVNAIAPGILLTEANRRSMPGADTTRWVTPAEIAQLILFLCSDDARSISGNTVMVTGSL